VAFETMDDLASLDIPHHRDIGHVTCEKATSVGSDRHGSKWRTLCFEAAEFGLAFEVPQPQAANGLKAL
jgi:hypothetical protein